MTKKKSCGALLYSKKGGDIGIILGKEYGRWFPMKGCPKKKESLKETAIREIYEETSGIVTVKNKEIKLDCKFETRNKKYYIGLINVPIDIIEQFNVQRITKTEKNIEMLEKDELRFYPIKTIDKYTFPGITTIIIKHYKKYLLHLNSVS